MLAYSSNNRLYNNNNNKNDNKNNNDRAWCNRVGLRQAPPTPTQWTKTDAETVIAIQRKKCHPAQCTK